MPETGENVAEEFRWARRPGRLRLELAAARRQGDGGGLFAEEIVPVEVPGQGPGPVSVDKDEHLRPDTRSRPRQAQALRANPGSDHRRQRLRHQRRRRRGAPRLGENAAKARLTPRARFLGSLRPACRRASWASARALDPQAAGAARAQDRRLRLDRDQRGLRRRAPWPHARARAADGRARQSARRRDRARPSARHVGARCPRPHRLGKRRRKLALATMCVGVGQGVSLALERVVPVPRSVPLIGLMWELAGQGTLGALARYARSWGRPTSFESRPSGAHR